jgi:hypothetical protein
MNEADRKLRTEVFPKPLQFKEMQKSPGFVARAISLAKATAQHAMAGFPHPTPEEQERRRAVCEGCSKRVDGVCTVCGCATNKKTSWLLQQCPINKWDHILPTIESDPYFTLRHGCPAGEMPSDDAMRAALKEACRHRTSIPSAMKGRGVVYAAGGWRFIVGVYVSVRMLRWLRCEYPVEVWYNGDLPGEFDPKYVKLLERLNVTFHDAAAKLRELGIKRRCSLGGWPLKPLAYLFSSFEEVLGLDADCYAVLDPRPLFDREQYLQHGAVLWPDRSNDKHGAPLKKGQWNLFGLVRRKTPGIESGQVLIDKRRHWHSLAVAAWLNDHHDFCYLPDGRAGLLGDKDTFAIGFHAADSWGGPQIGAPYAIAPATKWMHAAFLQHDFNGNVVFIHRCRDKPRIGEHSYGTPQAAPDRMMRCDHSGGYEPQLAHEWKVHELVEQCRQKIEAINHPKSECPGDYHITPSTKLARVLVPMIYKPDLHQDLKNSMTDNLHRLIHANPMFDIDVVSDNTKFQSLPGDRIWGKVGRARNAIIQKHLRPYHSYVLWIDADIVAYPADILQQLYHANPQGVTAPAVMIEDDRIFYDWAAFVQADAENNPITVKPEPPFYPYPDKIKPDGSLEMLGVGSMYLMPAWVYNKGIWHDDTPWTDHYPICEAVIAAGQKVICLTKLRVDHAELPRYGEVWH